MKNSFTLLITVLVLMAASASAQEMVVGNVKVLQVEGVGAVLIDSAGRRSEITPGSFIRQGSKVITGPNSNVSLLFENGSTVNVQPGSELSIDQFLRNPFDSDAVNFKKLENEPSNSVTNLSVPAGNIIFEVAKLKKGSSLDIKTPVGVAGIRGTSGSAGSDGVTTATGLISVTTATGTTNVPAGSQINPRGVQTAANPATISTIAGTNSKISSAISANSFQGAPPNLTPQQQSTLDAAASQGDQALAQAAAEIAAVAPEAAADIAAVAANMSPTAAPAIAATVASAVPASFAVAIAQSVAQQAPLQAQAIAQAVTSAVPSADANAVNSAATAGAAAAAPAAQGASSNNNSSQNSGDQGTSTAGESTGMGGGSGAPRPTPPSSP